jgi:polar amino acid transport system permease protein
MADVGQVPAGAGGGDAAARPEVIKAIPIRHWGRWISAAVIIYVAIALVVSLLKNPNTELSVIRQYLFASLVIHGWIVTLYVTFISMAVGIIGGTILAVMRLSANYILKGVSGFYIWFFRGTPVLVQILFWGYIGAEYPRVFVGLPFTHLVFGSFSANVIGGVVAGVLALGLNEAAYMAEFVRAGIISVDAGQTEAAESLGMSPTLTMRRVVLPQAMRVIIPAMGNETISMLKTTSLLLVIAAHELMTNVQIVYSQTFQQIPLLIVASLWYLFFTTLMTIGQHYLEAYFGKGFGTAEAEAAEKRAERRAARAHA